MLLPNKRDGLGVTNFTSFNKVQQGLVRKVVVEIFSRGSLWRTRIDKYGCFGMSFLWCLLEGKVRGCGRCHVGLG